MFNVQKIRQEPFYVIGYTSATNTMQEMNFSESVKGRLFEYLAKAPWVGDIGDLVEEKICCVYHGMDTEPGDRFKLTVGLPVYSPPEGIKASLDILPVPEGEYAQIESAVGPFPEIINETWQRVSEMSPEEIGGVRKADYDIECFSRNKFESHHCQFTLRLALHG
tara:strand:+ start:1686 stop:2180 length:495 start_codon:yes stop_codon:yes gene_type:complete